MKKLLLLTVPVLMIAGIGFLYAQGNGPEGNAPVVAKPAFPMVNWVSNNVSNVVTIENGTGAPLVIQITVAGTEDSPGIKVTNCGTTTEIKAGSTVICTTSDPSKPVSFNSDSSKPAVGTYQIQQQ